MVAMSPPSRHPVRWRIAGRRGIAVVALVIAVVASVAASAAGDRVDGGALRRFVTAGSWGGLGTSNGQFGTVVHSVAADGTYVYVADTNNLRVQVFGSKRGTFVREYRVGEPVRDVAVGPDGDVWIAVGAAGTVQRFPRAGVVPVRALDVPQSADGVAVDGAGNVLVASNGDNYHRLIRYDRDAAYVAGEDWGGMRMPGDVESSSDGTFYVADLVGSPPNVRRFALDGSPLGRIETDLPPTSTTGAQLGIGVDPDCNVWTTNVPRRRLDLYSQRGTLLATATSGDLVATDVAVDPRGTVFAWDGNTQRVFRFVEDRSARAPATVVPGSVRVAIDEEAGGWSAVVGFVADGISCPAELTATATVSGRTLRGRATVTVAAGARSDIAVRLPLGALRKAAGTTQRATFTIILRTNGRPTTRTAEISLRVPADIA